jgi:PAS domain-containing protein
VRQQDVELILTRQWASYLAVPVWLAGADENLLYYNEPAEQLLGLRFDETGAMPLGELSDVFQIMDEDGSPLPPAEIPLGVALRGRRPAYRSLRWRGLDGVWHHGAVTAFPLEGQGGRHLGAVAIFWEGEEP